MDVSCARLRLPSDFGQITRDANTPIAKTAKAIASLKSALTPASSVVNTEPF
jgi:hypothetical protein